MPQTRTKPCQDEPVAPLAPPRHRCTAAYPSMMVPKYRHVMFLVVEKTLLYHKGSDMHCFAALKCKERTLFQLLLYITYCFKGKVIQITLENPEVHTLSTPIREDFSEALLFCFILDLSEEHSSNVQILNGELDTSDIEDENFGDLNVFLCNEASADDIHDEAFNAFMRLSLVKHKISSLNYAMINMRDSKGEMSVMFDCLDYVSDTMVSRNMDKKKVQGLMGSAYIPACSAGRSVHAIPATIQDLSLEALRDSMSAIVDLDFSGQGKSLFYSLMDTMSARNWASQGYVAKAYKSGREHDQRFLHKLRNLVDKLADSGGATSIDVHPFIVFEYKMDSLITRERPAAFLDIMVHKHVPLPQGILSKTISDLGEWRRTAALVDIFHEGGCGCSDRCTQECVASYACLYNISVEHPFDMVRQEDTFEKLFPHLAKLSRLATEVKTKYSFMGSLKLFENMATMVYMGLADGRFSAPERVESMYAGLSSLTGDSRANSALSLGKQCPDVYRKLHRGMLSNVESSGFDPIKLYDRALVSHLFVDKFHVHRLFQASATFNYVITNTAPRYTIERCMLFNFTAPGEGKTFINKLILLLFHLVKGCIETLTSFTPQSFKYHKMRTSWTVMIEDTHNSEKNMNGLDRDLCNIPNVFKHLLDDSIVESNVVFRCPTMGALETTKVHSVHNCGFVWTTNTLEHTSPAWLDRSLVMTSEFTPSTVRTRSTQDIIDTVSAERMDVISATCLFRQNLVQCTNMICHHELMQFTEAFDTARTSCINVLRSTFLLHCGKRGKNNQRMLGIINQMVFAEAMKLACHFVFDLWVPPWTTVPESRSSDCSGHIHFFKKLNMARMEALDKLSFGQVCLEVASVFKLCSAACLPDILPKVIDTQADFSCQVLAYVLKQVYEQSCLIVSYTSTGAIQVAGINQLYFPTEKLPASSVAHEMLAQCGLCSFPSRTCDGDMRSQTLCTFVKERKDRENGFTKKMPYKTQFKISSVAVYPEVIYDLLALYAPESHHAFWDKMSTSIVEAYEQGNVQVAGGGFFNQIVVPEDGDGHESFRAPPRTIAFTIDFKDDPVQSMILQGTKGVQALKEMSFVKSNGLELHRYDCVVPIYYGAVISNRPGSPPDAFNAHHFKESRAGPPGTFHGPRLKVCSPKYSGLPIVNLSSFCKTRTVYHQDSIILSLNEQPEGFQAHHAALEEDWEWKDAVAAMNSICPNKPFTIENLKADYASTMASVCPGYKLSDDEALCRRLGYSQSSSNLDPDYASTMASAHATDKLPGRKPFSTLSQSQQSKSDEEFSATELRKHGCKRSIGSESSSLYGQYNKRLSKDRYNDSN